MMLNANPSSWGRLARIGVDSALADAGAVAGDDVRIGDIVFTYEPKSDEDEL